MSAISNPILIDELQDGETFVEGAYVHPESFEPMRKTSMGRFVVMDRVDPLAEPPRIVVDLAGALEKITPEMMDSVRDIMIEGLTKSGTKMLNALQEIISLCERDASVAEIAAVAKEGLPK